MWRELISLCWLERVVLLDTAYQGQKLGEARRKIADVSADIGADGCEHMRHGAPVRHWTDIPRR